jgi:hypothetical protein
MILDALSTAADNDVAIADSLAAAEELAIPVIVLGSIVTASPSRAIIRSTEKGLMNSSPIARSWMSPRAQLTTMLQSILN